MVKSTPKRFILVTGGAGFVGRHLVDHFAAKGGAVRSLDVLPGPPREHRANVEHVQGDIRVPADVAAAMRDITHVVHSAALVPVSRAGREFWQVNVDGTRNLLAASLVQGVQKVVHVSSSAVYGTKPAAVITEATPLQPHGDYGKSKAEAEAVCNEFRRQGLDISIVRPRTVLGPGRLGILEILFERIRRGRTFFVLGKGTNRFQLVSAHDLVQSIDLALHKKCPNEDFNVGAKEFRSLREDLEALAGHAGTGSKVVSLPAAPVRWGLAMLGTLRLSPFVSYHYEIVGKSFAYDTSKAERLLGWRARDSNAAMLIETYEWFLAQKDAPTTRASAHSQGVRTLLGNVLKK